MYVGPNHWTSTRVHACSSSLLLLRLIRGSCHLPDGLFGVGKAEWGIKSDVESEGGRFSPCFGQTVAAGGGAGGQCESNCGIRLESSNLKCAHYDESGRGLDVTSGGTVDCVPPPPRASDLQILPPIRRAVLLFLARTPSRSERCRATATAKPRNNAFYSIASERGTGVKKR